MKRLFGGLLLLVAVAVSIAAAGLAWAHLAVRRERPPLPSAEAIAALAREADLPVGLSFVNTARQAMPRSSVLAPGQDPHPDRPFVMSFAAFVLEWADGRLLLVDAGMDRASALEFGRVTQMLGAQPIEPLASVADTLGAARGRIGGVVFTHLHTDHTNGLIALCSTPTPRIPVFMTEAQATRPNYTTRPGLRHVADAGCADTVTLPPAPLMPLGGFPGAAVIHAAGHTPGSQILAAAMASPDGPRITLLAGDIANNIDGIRSDVPKPFLYSLLVVPEDRERLGEVRRFLRDLEARHGWRVLIAHDQGALDASGVPAWSPRG